MIASLCRYCGLTGWSERVVRVLMSTPELSCVLLADRHHGLAEGMRGLLSALFESVVMVADPVSLVETAARLGPSLAVVDVSLACGDNLRWLRQLRERCPGLKVVVLSVHDEPNVESAALAAGADAFVLKRTLVTDLPAAIDRLGVARAAHPSRASLPCL